MLGLTWVHIEESTHRYVRVLPQSNYFEVGPTTYHSHVRDYTLLSPVWLNNDMYESSIHSQLEPLEPLMAS